jgi:hypothetical protein
MKLRPSPTGMHPSFWSAPLAAHRSPVIHASRGEPGLP